MEPVTQGGGGLSHTGGIQEAAGHTCQVCFELDSCNAQRVGLDGLVGPFQLYYSMILCFQGHESVSNHFYHTVGMSRPKGYLRKMEGSSLPAPWISCVAFGCTGTILG